MNSFLLLRWEAAHVPKVKVAKLERSRLDKEQTAYMPQIPYIEKCPQHLLPLKEWEDAFIADFSDLRMVCLFRQFSFFFLICLLQFIVIG